jgi:hypothetical protein
MAALKLAAFAAACGRIGAVVLDGETLIDWRISGKAAESPADAASFAEQLFDTFAPEVVITEEPATARRKGKHSLTLTAAIMAAAAERQLMALSLPRRQLYPNKYAEADALVERYPELAPWQPRKRRFYENEPRNTVLFEALSLALAIVGGGSDRLADK